MAILFFQIGIVFDYTHIVLEHENTCEKCELIERIIENTNKLVFFISIVAVIFIYNYVIISKIFEINSLFTLVSMKVQANE